MLNVMIMCGGNGTRLWQLSRDSLPKQFLKLTNDINTEAYKPKRFKFR